MVTDASVSMVTRHGLSSVQPSAMRLSSLVLARALSVKRGNEGGDASGPYSRRLLLVSRILVDPLVRFIRTVSSEMTAFPYCQHTGPQFLWRSAGGDRVPIGALVISHSLAGGPARFRRLQLKGLIEGLVEQPVATHEEMLLHFSV
jgi:hypothetical protein